MGMKELLIPTLKNGTSVVTISIGALADDELRNSAIIEAKKRGARIHIASGATGGFDVLRTATLMGNSSAQFLNVKGVGSLRRSSFYSPDLEKETRTIFSGTAREAIRTFPHGLNVAVAASLASVGPEDMRVTMQSAPDFVGDTQKVEIKNHEVHAVIDVYSATPAIAGWSIVSTLINITSPIVF